MSIKEPRNQKYRAYRAMRSHYKSTMSLFNKGLRCIVLDCDNVLWQGEVSEGNAVVTTRHKEFHKLIYSLYLRGIYIVLCSKNEESDVLNFIRNSRMIISEDILSFSAINWNPKSENIRQISNYLKTDFDKIVFVDDSISEINEVRSNISDIHTLLFNLNDYRAIMSRVNLNPLESLKTSKLRQMTVVSRRKREAMLEGRQLSEDEIFEMMETKIEYLEDLSDEILLRISELSFRTNRLTNGIRLSVDELRNFISGGHTVIAINLTDKFGDYGIISAICAKEEEIDLFCLSCRASNRGIESRIMQFIKSTYKMKRIKIRRTERNNDFLEKLGFSLELMEEK